MHSSAWSPDCLLDILWTKEYDVWTEDDIETVIAGLEGMLEKKRAENAQVSSD